jgi:hypothetical protein
MQVAEPGVAVWVRGGLAAAWAVIVGVASLVVLALVVWAADSGSTASAGAASRFAVQIWLLAHRTPLRLSPGTLAIPPLALTLGLGALVARGAAIVTRTVEATSRREAGLVIAAVAVPYAILASVLAAATPSTTFRPSVGAAFVCALLVGGISAAIGAMRSAALRDAVLDAIPVNLRVAISAAGAACAVVAGAAAVLTIGSLLSHTHTFGALVGGYHDGPGEFAMVLLSLFMLPNAVVFAIGYIAGPGFAVGAGTSVAYGGAHLGALPAFPLLAALPTGAAPWQVTALFIAAVAAAGATAGLRITRSVRGGLRPQAQAVAGAAAVLGVAVTAAVAFAGGPGGPGRLAAVGPSPWQVGLILAAEVGIASLLTVFGREAVTRLRARS